MKKWFDTYYHYILPRFSVNQTCALFMDELFEYVKLAFEKDYRVKPFILGPLSFLSFRTRKKESFDKFSWLEKLLPYTLNFWVFFFVG